MRTICVCFVLAVVAPALADEPTLKDARKRWLTGDYAEAREQYAALLKQAKTRVPAAVGLSRSWQSEGEYDKALQVIDAALKDDPNSADLHGRRAELLHLRGRWEDALAAAEKTLALDKDHFLARWVRAQVYQDKGELRKADTELRWFVKTYSARSNADKDISDPDELLLVGLAGAENARWHNLDDQFKVVLNDVYGDALKNEKEFWPAESQAGMLLLEKYNRPEALEAFDKALKINPSAAEALVGKGMAAVQKYEIRDAERFAERALKINEHLPEALRLRADIHLMAGDVKAALKELESARKVNPRDEQTLGRIAACFLLQHKDADFAALEKEVAARDPRPGVFYQELAGTLDERKQWDASEKYYRKAFELRPMLSQARISLGMLQMRMGREKEARQILTKAFDADAFNIRVANSLKVLRHLEKYETIKTAHFELRFDPLTDKILARYMAAQLEDLYGELAGQFDYRPAGPFLIEIFNNHEMFSGRVVAVPDLHTIGACTGRMLAMVSPHGKGVAKPFNWSRVLRHEMVHIFNLDQTRFQVPHWLTEGLAVSNEGFPRPPSWNELLVERVPKGELMNLENINLGFIRPRSPLDWHMAYCQSQLYVEHLKKKYGPQTIGELLTAYRDGLDTAAAIAKACKVDKATFEKGYREYLQAVVKTIQGKPAEKPMSLPQLREAHRKNPKDDDLAARLAERYLAQNRAGEALELAKAVLNRKPAHPLACYVRARLHIRGGESEEAVKLLESAAAAQPPEPKVLALLGSIYYDNKQLNKAEKTFEQGRKAEPYETKWLTNLARVHAQTGNKDKLIAVLKDLAPTDADDLAARKRLARLLLDANRPAEAETYARQVLDIDVSDADGQEIIVKALTAQKKDAEAERVKKLLGK